ncbi:MAG: hypothetical protein NT075_28900 [Chloroflexi bacterium]|nr:hypothetical protein [Chloroflexota bacterium]
MRSLLFLHRRKIERIAQTKRARLVIFPELAGLMVAPPLLKDVRSNLLKRADRGKRKRASVPQRLTGLLAYYAAGLLRADFRQSLGALLDVGANDVWQAYTELFGGLAREFGMTIVAPSAYLPDPLDGIIRNMAVVFASDGARLGYQTKVLLPPEDEDLVQAGSAWDVIPTEVGALGVVLGSDVLYPEVGRLLAYQGAEILVVLGASPSVELYQKLRTGTLARMQDNQLFGIVSFLVGDNELSVAHEPMIGRSAIFAPQELTPRRNGILVEMGNQRSEGVLTAELDFLALKALWESSDTPVRKMLPLEQAGQMLAKFYQRLQVLPRLARQEALSATSPAEELASLALLPTLDKASIPLDDLTVLSSLTSRWPLHGNHQQLKQAGANVTDLAELPGNLLNDLDRQNAARSRNAASVARSDVIVDDETDEMDALPGAGNERG